MKGGGIYIAASAATGRHFHGKQGLFFVSVVNVGSGMGGVIFPYFFNYLTERFGPRGTYLITGGILLNMIPFTMLWNSPITKKLTKPKHEQNVCNDNAIEMESLTSVKSEVKTCYADKDTLCAAFKKLVTDRAFVFFAFGLATAYSCVMVVNVFDALQDSGLSQTNATLGLLLLNISGIIGRILPGTLIQIKYITVLTVPIIACIMIILSQLGITLLSSITTNFLACILAGTAIGMLMSCFGVVTLKLVGIERHANAMGICLSLSGLTNALMGQFGGWIRDKLGYYTIPFLLSASVEVLAIILLSIAQFYRSKYPKRLTDELKDKLATAGWLVCLSAFLANLLALGVFFSMGTLLSDIMDTFNVTRAEAALVQSVGITGHLWAKGNMSDHWWDFSSYDTINIAMETTYYKEIEAVNKFARCSWRTGTAIGMFSSTFGVATLKLVGTERQATAMGICLSLSGITNAVLGPIGGLIRDKTGSYTIPFLLSASVEVLAIVLLIMAQFYRFKDRRSAEKQMPVYYNTRF
ncbi:MOT14-like protein [Mya arenaria]|uniref:MOT14-like protein n=1 Tax=Mya arenaria TaxID=6604 RepID=A0ABY7GA20_MYAAR|nr:MOT14-like protein [Mya arenaria]